MVEISRKDRAVGAIMGTLIGDALGLGCHWYYDLEAMRADYGDWISDYTDQNQTVLTASIISPSIGTHLDLRRVTFRKPVKC